MADFDPEDKNGWYFGMMTREDTNSMLQSEKDSGVFLVRDSTTIRGDFVLCVKEDNKVSHYIINKIQTGGMIRFRIGDQEFSSLPALLQFYKTHYLDTTPLIRPAQRLKYITKYKFTGRDPDDLPFEKGEILSLVRKDEEQWWTACNSRNQMGLVPVPYIERYNEGTAPMMPVFLEQPQYNHPTTTLQTNSTLLLLPSNGSTMQQKQLPASAKVIKTRIPNAYDKSQLKLTVGDVVTVTAMNISGQWEGELNGIKGSFPFTHVKFIDDIDIDQEM